MRSRRLKLIAAAAALLLGACSGSGGSEVPASALKDGTSSGARDFEPTTCPLTGAKPKSDVELDRPAVAIKIEDDPAARPQSGLEDADLVFEERVEGGITRFLVLYHCADSSHAGPVRSGRFDDPKLAGPFTRLLAASGSNSIVEREMKKRGMIYKDEDSTTALFRDPPGSGEIHSLFANTKKLRKIAARKKLKPPTYDVFKFGALEGNHKKVKKVTINFTDNNLIEYQWSSRGWKRFEAGQPFMAAAGDQIAVSNLVIQQVRVDNSAHLVDVAGNPSPEITLANSSGRLLLFRDGAVVRGTWKLGDPGEPPVYETAAGDPMTFDTGPIWIELVPSSKGDVKGKFSFK
jgi:Protein of unknown function (DUF3048) N-terminal domain/Protein of unknown function (DUF3048) C-terminal domain